MEVKLVEVVVELMKVGVELVEVMVELMKVRIELVEVVVEEEERMVMVEEVMTSILVVEDSFEENTSITIEVLPITIIAVDIEEV